MSAFLFPEFFDNKKVEGDKRQNGNQTTLEY